ncbi:hypothetical protein DBV15_04035 [Temnothorax longispinosus]|uniref:Uncharacterized protein n=1 Tax=Temnothorax longispinosus TaxID=300112 RepID=A0A4S2KCU8_9HYME|nr:hypothetical protein DBV15_04035 [Temnothorax longispinosus]
MRNMVYFCFNFSETHGATYKGDPCREDIYFMNQHPFFLLLQNCSLLVERGRKTKERKKTIDLVCSPGSRGRANQNSTLSNFFPYCLQISIDVRFLMVLFEVKKRTFDTLTISRTSLDLKMSNFPNQQLWNNSRSENLVMFNLLFGDCLVLQPIARGNFRPRGPRRLFDRLFGLSDHGGLTINAKTTEMFVNANGQAAYTHNSNACISSRDACARARVCVPGNVVQDASPRIKERNRPVKYNFATTGEGGATRVGRLSFSRVNSLFISLLCDTSLVRINQFSLHFFALIEIRGERRRLLPSVRLGRAALPDIFSYYNYYYYYYYYYIIIIIL